MVPGANALEQLVPQSIPAGCDTTVPTPSRVTLSTGAFPANVAVTILAASIVTRQTPIPLQAPDQPANAEPEAGAAVKVTIAPGAKGASQVAPQSIPAGCEVTEPAPAPARATVSVCVVIAVNSAVTIRASLTVTVQAAVPVQAPDHPTNVDPAIAVAVRVTLASPGYEAEQVAPQSIPAGVEVTVPSPVPVLVTVSVFPAEKVAATARASVMVTVHSAAPVQAPDHPTNIDPAAGAAVKVTVAPLGYEAAQFGPQSRPPALAPTLPPPVPSLVTVRVYPGMKVAETR
jgi:hypothetical protein